MADQATPTTSAPVQTAVNKAAEAAPAAGGEQAQGPDYQQAFDVLIGNVFAQPFFAKLAVDYGIQPANEDEARKLLALAERLNVMDEMGLAKSASDRGSFLDQTIAKVDQILGMSQPQVSAPEVKQAAAQWAALPAVRDAALLYQDALQQMAAA